MRREFSSGRRLRVNKRGQWVSPLMDNVSMVTVKHDAPQETADAIYDAIAKAEPK